VRADGFSTVPQPTPPLAVSTCLPDKIVRLGEGHYFIDFGSEIAASTVFRVSGAKGHEVEIRHGEELLEPNRVRYDMRCNCLYQEFCTLSGRHDEVLEFYDYKGFRYVEVLNWPEELTPDRVWAHQRHYPFPEDASYFHSSDSLLNAIWALCRNGARVGTLDSYLDCPTREKGGFMGDGYVTGISHLISTGDTRILPKFLQDVADTRRFCPGLLSTAPNYINGELAEYSLLWPVLLAYYYRWSGDQEFVRDMMPVLKGLLTYYADYENSDGLLQDVFSKTTGRYSVLVDWPTNLRDGYDDPYLMGARTVEDDPSGVVNTMVQGFYVCALNASGFLAREVGDADIVGMVTGRIARISLALPDQLRDPVTGLFVDRNDSSHSSLHANVTPLMAGVLDGDEKACIVDFISQKRLSCGVYFSFFVLQSLYAAGEYELAYDLMTSHDLHAWHSMLEAGATTCMEAWTPDLKWNTSWCHPWSSAPINMIAHELMGLTPLTPGWKTIRFAPRLPRRLREATIRLTIPNGVIAAHFQRDREFVIYSFTVPEGCSLFCDFGPGVQSATAEGHPVDLQAAFEAGHTSIRVQY
jgi:alpha-L-rhamnosidase